VSVEGRASWQRQFLPNRIRSIDHHALAWAVVLAAMGLSFALGVHALSGRPLSEDEASSLRFATASQYSGIRADGGNMLLYYVMLRFVVEVFGDTLTAVRLPSVLFGVATVPVVYLIGRRLASIRVGVFAALLFAVNLPVVFWQQNARAYTMGTLLVAISTLAFIAMLESDGKVPSCIYVVATVTACYTLLFAGFAVLAQLLSLLVRKPGRIPMKRLLVTVGASLLCCAPLVFFAHSRGTGGVAWVPRPDADSLRVTGLVLMSAGSANGPTATAWAADLLGYGSLVACAALVAWSVVATARGARSRHAYAVALFSLLCFLPPLVVFAESQVATTHLYLDRYFTICLPAGTLLLALAIDCVRPASAAIGVLVVTAGLRFSVIPETYGVPVDMQSAAHYLTTSARPGDCITFSIPQRPMTAGIATDLAYYQAHSSGHPRLPSPVLPYFSWRSALSSSFSEPSSDQSFDAVRVGCHRLWIAVEPSTLAQPQVGLLGEAYWFVRHGWTDVSTQDFPGLHLLLLGPS
jgi:mannosyltransferase